MAIYGKPNAEPEYPEFGTAATYTCRCYLKYQSEYLALGKLYGDLLPPCLFLLNGFTLEERVRAMDSKFMEKVLLATEEKED